MLIKKISKGTISKRKDGKWIGQALVTYENLSKKRICVSAKTESECKQKLELKKQLCINASKEISTNKQSNKQSIEKKDTYINYLLTKWLAEKTSEGCNEKTLSNYRYSILKHFTFFNDMSPQEISTSDVLEFQNYCLNKAKLSNGAYSTLFSILNNSFNKLLRDNVITKSPTAFLKFKKGMEVEKELFTENEINMLFQEAKEYDLPTSLHKPCKMMYPFLLCAMNTGMRRGEICSLQWKDVNVEKLTITVKHSITIVSNHERKPKEYLSDTKNKKIRTVPINKKLLNELLILKNKYNSPFVFPDYRNPKRFVSPRSISNAYRHLQKRTGVKKSLHTYRHQFISKALENGLSLKLVMDLVGHSSLTITQRYWKSNVEKYDSVRNLFT